MCFGGCQCARCNPCDECDGKGGWTTQYQVNNVPKGVWVECKECRGSGSWAKTFRNDK